MPIPESLSGNSNAEMIRNKFNILNFSENIKSDEIDPFEGIQEHSLADVVEQFCQSEENDSDLDNTDIRVEIPKDVLAEIALIKKSSSLDKNH